MVELSTIFKNRAALKKIVRRNSDFFYALFIIKDFVMNEIKKIREIEHESLDYISHFLDNFDYSNSTQYVCKIGDIRNDLIYYNKNVSLAGNILTPIKGSIITSFNDKKLTEEFTKLVDYLKTIYELKYLWVMVYAPESNLNFHWDHGKNRHVISLNHNDMFFNYENNEQLKHNSSSKHDLYNEKLKEYGSDIDSFNEFFTNDSQVSSIHVLDTKSVYVFGNSLHTFVNASNKLRVALVFEIMN